MPCPNCKKPFVVEQDDKANCFDCGWFVKVDNEWRVYSELAPAPAPEPSPAALEPDPAALEPDPAALEPAPAELPDSNVKSYFGGLFTITEVDE